MEDQLKSVELEKQIVLEPYYAAAEFKAIAVINDTLDIMRSYAEDDDLRANLPLMTNKIGELTKALRGLTANSVSSSIGDKNSGSQINVQIVNEIV